MVPVGVRVEADTGIMLILLYVMVRSAVVAVEVLVMSIEEMLATPVLPKMILILEMEDREEMVVVQYGFMQMR